MKYIDQQLYDDLFPSVSVTQERISKLHNEKQTKHEALSFIESLENLQMRRGELGKKPPKKEQPKVERNDISEGLGDFYTTLETLLNNWSYTAKKTIFNEHFDLLINNNKFNSNGKGYRAIIRSAFTIALMDTVKNHFRFCIIDSPITSYKKKGVEDTDEESDPEVTEDIQSSFFLNNAQRDEGQVIILENKIVPKDLRSEMNYIYFSGSDKSGREGLFPNGSELH